VLYAFQLAHGKDYRANLEIPIEPDLASAEQPALVVVFKTGDPWPISGAAPMPRHHLCGAVSAAWRSKRVRGSDRVKDPVFILNVDESKIILPPASAPRARLPACSPTPRTRSRR